MINETAVSVPCRKCGGSGEVPDPTSASGYRHCLCWQTQGREVVDAPTVPVEPDVAAQESAHALMKDARERAERRGYDRAKADYSAFLTEVDSYFSLLYHRHRDRASIDTSLDLSFQRILGRLRRVANGEALLPEQRSEGEDKRLPRDKWERPMEIL